MQPYRWLFGLSAACLLAVAACSSDAPADPGYYLVHRPAASAVVTPVVFMTAAGCRSVNDHPTVGAVVIGRPDSGFDLFTCSELSRDSVHALSIAYKRLLVAAKLRGEAETEAGGGGYWMLIDWNQTCTTQNMNGLIGGGGYAPDGTKKLFDLGTQANCWTTLTYGWVPDDGGGGGSGGGDPGDGADGSPGFPDNPPPNPLPYPVSVTVSPGNSIMESGDISAPGMVTATVTYSDGTTMTAPDAVTWSVASGGNVLAVDDPGTFHALMAGTATIKATAGSASGSATVTVIEPTASADSMTVDFEVTDPCVKGDLGDCPGTALHDGQFATITSAIGAIKDDGGFCSSIKSALASMDSSQFRDLGDLGTNIAGTTVAMSSWDTLATANDAVTGMVIGLSTKGFQGISATNPHTTAQTLVHEVIHAKLHILATAKRETEIDYKANQCVIGGR